MRRSVPVIVVAMVWACVLIGVAGAQKAPQADHKHDDDGWTIPAGAENEKSPLTVNPTVVAAGQKLFSKNCQRCHGKLGKGDGPDAEPKHRKDMDLTNPARVDDNPDGVVFYRIWNGRKSPKMPVFSRELTKEQAWALVAYVQTLRAK